MEEKLKAGFSLYTLAQDGEIKGLYERKSGGSITKITPVEEELKIFTVLPTIMKELETGQTLEVRYTDRKYYASIKENTEEGLEIKYQKHSNFFPSVLAELETEISEKNAPSILLETKKR